MMLYPNLIKLQCDMTMTWKIQYKLGKQTLVICVVNSFSNYNKSRLYFGEAFTSPHAINVC